MFFNRLSEKITRFMYGRYGSDLLNRFLTVMYFVLYIISALVQIFLSARAGYILYLMSTALLIFSLFRMFSKNIEKRSRENSAYLGHRARWIKTFGPSFRKIADWFKLQKNRLRDRKTHVYKKCPKCKAVLRLRKEKGRHTTRCPKCGNAFDIKI